MVLGSWADASDRPRPHDCQTGGLRDSLLHKRCSGKVKKTVPARGPGDLPNFQGRMLARTKERLRLLRLVTKTGGWHEFFWSEMDGAPMKRWHLDEAVRQVGGMLITVSRGIFEALPRSESPQLRLRSARTGE